MLVMNDVPDIPAALWLAGSLFLGVHAGREFAEEDNKGRRALPCNGWHKSRQFVVAT
jgi:hypothetical protein